MLSACSFIRWIFEGQLTSQNTSNKNDVLNWIPFSKSKPRYEPFAHGFYHKDFSTENSETPLKTSSPLLSSVCSLKPAHQFKSSQDLCQLIMICIFLSLTALVGWTIFTATSYFLLALSSCFVNQTSTLLKRFSYRGSVMDTAKLYWPKRES